jgi:hypothetical protein
MPVEHIVLIEPKPDVSDERMQEVMEMTAGFKGGIPGVTDVKWGRNFTDRAGDYSWGLIVTLDNTDALEGYRPHPVHQDVAEILGGLCANVLSFDFET